MRIGEFIEEVCTTKDTVRHYEELGLLTPKKNGRRKEYLHQDVLNFRTVKELQALGLTLTDVALIFEMKRNLGCGSRILIESTRAKLLEVIDQVQKQADELRLRRRDLSWMKYWGKWLDEFHSTCSSRGSGPCCRNRCTG